MAPDNRPEASGGDPPPAFLPILRIRSADLTPTAIVVGDPARARAVGELLEDVRTLGENREYVTLAGTREGAPIVVASHGVGATGANVCFAELLRGGVRTILRAGTCGAIVEGVEDGDLVIAAAAVREDGASDQLIHLAYPAVADRRVTAALADAVVRAGRHAREGIVVTEGNFYPGAFPPRWQRYRDWGPLAVEMELASLYVIASMHGARAGGILAVDGNLIAERRADMSDYDPHRKVVAEGVASMLEIAVSAAVELQRDE